MILIGKKLSPTVSFILYDEGAEKISEVSNTELTSLILNKEVKNAQLENTVIKMTDGNLPEIDHGNENSVFYVLNCTDGVYSMVDGTGQIWKMSLNVARIFFKQGNKRMTNARLSSNEIIINKHRNYSTALRRSTEHYHHS